MCRHGDDAYWRENGLDMVENCTVMVALKLRDQRESEVVHRELEEARFSLMPIYYQDDFTEAGVAKLIDRLRDPADRGDDNDF